MHTPRRQVLTAIGLLMMAACQDNPTELDESRPVTDEVEVPTHTASGDGLDEEGHSDGIDPTRGRMRFTITAENDPAPKTPVTLLIEGVAIEPVTGGELSVTLPTKAAMDYAGPDDALYHPTGVKVSAIARWQLPAMAAGGRWKQRVTIPAMEKGYYRVAMSGATAGPPSDLGPFLIEEVYEQVWMFISDGRAQLTELFDPSVFPTGTRPVPGPILVRGLGRDAGDAAFAKPDTARRRYLYTSLSYYNGSEYVPAAGTRISGAYFPKRGGSGFNKETQTVPDNGINRWGCPGNNVTLKGSAIAQETEYITEAQWKLNAYWDAEKSECGDTIRVPASRYVYLPWYHLNESAENIQDHFGFERGRVKWRVRLTDESSYYTRWRDRITLNRRGYTSWWVAAHEYGHAIHNKALGGMWSTSNGNPHPVNKPTSYTCAFSEGFADYAGNIGAPDDWDYGDWETWSTRNTGTKGKIEGYIAALFHDLIDGGSETDDETEYDANYVATVFKTCRVRPLSGNWSDRNDVSDFVWCLENRVNVSVHRDKFPGIVTPIQAHETATKPDDWDADDIRSTWIKNVG